MIMDRNTIPKWVEKATFRKLNRKWLDYSSQIARRIMSEIIHDKDNSQKKLAEALEVSPQMVSKIIKGQENLTLKSIAKISDVLGIELITFPKYRYMESTLPKNVLLKFNVTLDFVQFKVMDSEDLLNLANNLAHHTGGNSVYIKNDVKNEKIYA